MVLVNYLVVSRFRVNVLRRSERFLLVVFFYFAVCKLATSEFDNDSPLAVCFFVDGLIIQGDIVIFSDCQSV
jgi:hypothetical protein